MGLSLYQNLYQGLIRPFLFQYDAEEAHYLTFNILKNYLNLNGAYQSVSNLLNTTSSEEVELFGLKFPNRVGLAAGFDKDAIIGRAWEALGFGFAELGTLTPKPQYGNPKPRLFRLVKDGAIINRMGFNNQGVEVAKERIITQPKGKMIIGGNIGKNKDTPNQEASNDYLNCFQALAPVVDYIAINVSSPNTPNLRDLHGKAELDLLLKTLQEANKSMAKPKPLLLKIAPDLNQDQLNDILEVVLANQLNGIISSNTTVSRNLKHTSAERIKEIGMGGLSGEPLKEMSLNQLLAIRKFVGKDFPIISVGGISTPQDGVERLLSGANLIQLYTGYIYFGPTLPAEINRLYHKQMGL